MESLGRERRPALGSDIVRAGIIASLLTAPLMILEVVNRPQSEGFPLPLFVFMWTLAFVGGVVAAPLARSFAAGMTRRPLSIAVGLVLLAVVAAVWVALLTDQMPCFLGVPNCD